MKEIRIYHRKDQVEELKHAIDTIQWAAKWFPDAITRHRGVGQFLRQFRIKYGIYETF